MPDPLVVEAPRRKSLRAANYIGINTSIHPDIHEACRVRAEIEGETLAQVWREALTDAYNCGWFTDPTTAE